jgi:hypothetical protein
MIANALIVVAAFAVGIFWNQLLEAWYQNRR